MAKHMLYKVNKKQKRCFRNAICVEGREGREKKTERKMGMMGQARMVKK
jgi:hypothetical protein